MAGCAGRRGVVPDRGLGRADGAGTCRARSHGPGRDAVPAETMPAPALSGLAHDEPLVMTAAVLVEPVGRAAAAGAHDTSLTTLHLAPPHAKGRTGRQARA